ncbi:MAG: glycosyl transferase group 1 [Candidatus Nomurabacteria bacterium]|nr:glycosyl transferase group 1 [Candidatus Nomurabacteria bacterium]
MKSPIRILFNDNRNNYPGSTHTPQGGPEIFSALFTSYFKDTPHHLTSVFFLNSIFLDAIASRKILSKKQHDYVELSYPRKTLNASYKEEYTKKEYLEFLAPWFEEMEKIFDAAKPDVVFLNGYALTNYFLFAVAKKRGIPVCMQHAGIWKEEIMTASGSAFSSSIRKIFISLEKDLTRYTTHHIFLNEHSKDRFLSAHNLTAADLHAVSVIPLPIPVPKVVRPVTLKKKASKPIAIGAVSRWDAIKNHSAILRLAEYIAENNIPATVSVVTNPFNGIASEFRDRYTKHVQVIAPMSSAKLVTFYRTCDVLILPSKFETLGGVVMEALIQGVPTVISDQTGWVREYQSFGLDALIISPNDSGKKLFDAINELFAHPERFIKKFARLQKQILSRQLAKHVFPQYEKIFISLSKQHHD